MPFDEETKRGIIDLSINEHISYSWNSKENNSHDNITVCDNKKILEYALVSNLQFIRNNTINIVWRGLSNFKEKVLELTDKRFQMRQMNVVVEAHLQPQCWKKKYILGNR